MSTAEVRSASHDDFVFEQDDRPLVPTGVYEAIYVWHETAIVFRVPKVFIWFRLVSPGPYFAKELYRAYRVKSIIGRPRKNGGFKLTRRSDLFIELARAFELKARPDRASARWFAGRVLRVAVRLVLTDYKQRQLPEFMRYSVIGEILGSQTIGSA